MSLKFWKRSRSPRRSAVPPYRWPTPFRPRLESLLDRIVPAVTFSVQNQVLTVTGEDVTEFITVRTLNNDVLVNNAPAGTLSGIRQVVINANGGNDQIDVSQLSLISPSDPPVSIDGGAGNDIITGSPMRDVILGGTENDKITANAGNDLVEGGAGNDTIQGNAGTDALFGDDGTDKLVETGNVNFTLTDAQLAAGSLGTDTVGEFEEAHLTGGSGANTITFEDFSGFVSVTGGAGDDEFLGDISSRATLVEGAIGGATAFVLRTTDVAEDQFRRVGVDTDRLFGVDHMTLTGSGLGDTFTFDGYEGRATLDGAAGVDRLITLPAPGLITLRDDFFRHGSGGADLMTSIEQAELNGDNDVVGDTIDASGFSGRTTIEGGGGPDRLIGGSDDDVIRGGLGNDTITGGPGDDDISAGLDLDDAFRETVTGNATLTNTSFVGNGTDTLAGINRAVIDGDDGPNNINATSFTSPVTLRGLGGNDALTGGSASDRLEGGDEDDVLDGNDGTDTLLGGDGTDTVDEERNADFTLTRGFGESATLFVSGFGTDNLGGVERANLTGGAGNNTLDATNFDGPVTLFGGDGDDTLMGGSNDDLLDGQGGNDRLLSRAGNNTLRGGTGNDDIDAANGDDVLEGGSGDDELAGSGGDDDLEGGSGDDVLEGGPGDDTLTGGAGNDAMDGGADVDTLSESFSSTNNKQISIDADSMRVIDGAGDFTDTHFGFQRLVISTTAGNNTVTLNPALAIPATITGGSGNDTLTGGLAADSISGGGGDDTLVGGDGKDEYHGGAGTDYIHARDGHVDRIYVDAFDLVLGDKKDKVRRV